MNELQGIHRRLLRLTGAAIFALLATAASAGAQDGGPDFELDAARQPAPVGYPVQPGIWRLHGTDPDLPTEDLEPLRRMIGKASVVALGETFHTSGGFYEMKHRLFRFLVQEMGFRVFAMESGWTGADLTAEYVQTCAGTAENAISRHIVVWQSEELADLVRWMCQWNREHPNPADKVHYFGFDIQQPGDDGPALVAFLQRIGIPEDHSWIAGIRSCDGVTVSYPFGEIPQEAHDRCIQALKEAETHIQRNQRTLLREMPAQDLEIAKLQLVGLRAWQLQVFTIFDDFEVGFSYRDVGMAYAFRALRAMRFPKAKTVLWAANSHVARSPLPDTRRPIGSHLAAWLGRNYVTFALAAYDTYGYLNDDCRFLPVAGAAEEKMSTLGEDALLVDLAFPGTRRPFLPPGRYPMGVDVVDLPRNFNGLIYLKSSDEMDSTLWGPCPR